MLLFVGTLYSDPEVLSFARELLKGQFGNTAHESPSLPWEYSSYYKDELGWPILRKFLFYENLIDPGSLADIKLKTNQMEEALSSGRRRRINLDPGYLSLSTIVLASTKNYVHRVYLGKGIYAEASLIFQEGTFRPHLFTYRDYQDKLYMDLFMSAREILKTARNKISETNY